MKILLLDNHDSFTWNLAELLRGFRKVNFIIVRNDALVYEEVESFDKIIFSPGPGLPSEHPGMAGILERYGEYKPVLGICLGLQAIALHFGGSLYNLPEVVHGQPRRIRIFRPEHYLFSKIPDNTEVGLYHSWTVDRPTLPDCLRITAISGDAKIMALEHRWFDICGLQFHPESIMTPDGSKMLGNWLSR